MISFICFTNKIFVAKAVGNASITCIAVWDDSTCSSNYLANAAQGCKAVCALLDNPSSLSFIHFLLFLFHDLKLIIVFHVCNTPIHDISLVISCTDCISSFQLL